MGPLYVSRVDKSCVVGAYLHGEGTQQVVDVSRYRLEWGRWVGGLIGKVAVFLGRMGGGDVFLFLVVVGFFFLSLLSLTPPSLTFFFKKWYIIL